MTRFVAISILLCSASMGGDTTYGSQLTARVAEIRANPSLLALGQEIRRGARGESPEIAGDLLEDLQVRHHGMSELQELERVLDQLLGEGLDLLANPQSPWALRRQAALSMGVSLPHPAWLGILKEVAQSQDDPRVRAAAVYSISFIDDPNVVPDLIEFLRDGDAQVRAAAWEQLNKLTGCAQDFGPEGGSALNACASWWQEHGSAFQYKRSRALVTQR